MAKKYGEISDNVDSNFTFVLRGKEYSMRYPTTEEIEQIQKVTSKLRQAEKEENFELVDELSSKLEGALYEFISCVGHETLIKEALSKENTQVVKNFNTMIRTELSIQ